eukprot:CAMPEP_0116572518 /NCGR_PEP_ID=MMETSP0397-20121206/18223_1 /TAXON_ID=216820 /ORGANISM="Cyclophora tenuis, Strain ECT3854" /LENGTH=127 /DNA_ID=CAMNT_0004100861 /DNA_START=572 /DNA_END=952 /DNA_ORIENTATION=+
MSNSTMARLLVALMMIASATSMTSSTLPFGRRRGTNFASIHQAVGHNSLSTDKSKALNTQKQRQQQQHPSPPEGSLYTISVTAPVIGRHDASVLFFKDSSCRLTINGSVKIDERVAFDMNPNGSFKY